MAAAAQEFATALTQEEVEFVLEQRRHVAATKAPPKRQPPAPGPPTPVQAAPPTTPHLGAYAPPWSPAGTFS